MITQSIALLLLIVLAGCATQNNTSTFTTSQLDNVVVLADPSITANALAVALNQVRNPNAPVAASLPKPATAPLQALPAVKKVAERPIIAITEYQDWLWFATDAVRDPRTQVIGSFLAGYAVQKGGRDLIKWGVW